MHRITAGSQPRRSGPLCVNVLPAQDTSLGSVLPARLRLALIALSLCAVAAVVGATLASRNDGAATSGLELSADGWAGAIRPPGQTVPDFTLTDQDGKPVSSAALKGDGPVVY